MKTPVEPDEEILPRIKHGWLQPYLLGLDLQFSRRWDYWLATLDAGKLLDDPIPQVEWSGQGSAAAMKNITQCLDRVHNRNRWDVFNSFVQWLLFGLGHPSYPDPPRNLEDRDSVFWYRTFNLGLMLQHPADYLGDIACEVYGSSKSHSGFFPTPMDICTMMAKMTFGDGDCRAKTVLDPCVGTGRLLMVASNYSLRLYGIDIDRGVLDICLVNMLLWAPWAVARPPWPIEGIDDVPIAADAQDASMPSPPVQLVTEEVQARFQRPTVQANLFEEVPA